MKERKFDLFEKKNENGSRLMDNMEEENSIEVEGVCREGTIMVIYRNTYPKDMYPFDRDKNKIYKNARSLDRTSIRGRRLHEYEWTESEDGSGSTTSGSRLSRATGSCRYIYPRISTTAGRSRTNHFYFVAHVSSLFLFLTVETVLNYF